MKSVALHDELFGGAVSVQGSSDGMTPWRIPYGDEDLFPPDGIGGKAVEAAGIRLGGHSETSVVRLSVAPSAQTRTIDCVIDRKTHASVRVAAGETIALFEGLPKRGKRIELYFDQRRAVTVTGLWIEPEAQWDAVEPASSRWIAYGSSITQCAEAPGPSATWPAIVSRAYGLDLTCLGFGANCMMEPMVARLIRDLPADYISCCVGINVYGQSALGPRTFLSSLIGFIRIIREKHPDTPLALVSPIYSAPREQTENKVGLTLSSVRDMVRETASLLIAKGDWKLVYIDGLELFGEPFASYLPDRLHPSGEGYRMLAERFSGLVAERCWGLTRLSH